MNIVNAGTPQGTNVGLGSDEIFLQISKKDLQELLECANLHCSMMLDASADIEYSKYIKTLQNWIIVIKHKVNR